jgi:hypothetical protein
MLLLWRLLAGRSSISSLGDDDGSSVQRVLLQRSSSWAGTDDGGSGLLSQRCALLGVFVFATDKRLLQLPHFVSTAAETETSALRCNEYHHPVRIVVNDDDDDAGQRRFIVDHCCF